MPMDVKFMRQALSAIYYGDLLMTLRAQTEPYELEKGAAERLPKQMAGHSLRPCPPWQRLLRPGNAEHHAENYV